MIAGDFGCFASGAGQPGVPGQEWPQVCCLLGSLPGMEQQVGFKPSEFVTHVESSISCK